MNTPPKDILEQQVGESAVDWKARLEDLGRRIVGAKEKATKAAQLQLDGEKIKAERQKLAAAKAEKAKADAEKAKADQAAKDQAPK